MEDTASPRVLAKMVVAGAKEPSFQAATEMLELLGNLTISSERVRRACTRVGADRIDHHRQLQQAFEAKMLPAQIRGKPADVAAPDIACVMTDGGRYQLLDRSQASTGSASACKGECWKESRIGLLATMSGAEHTSDPQPVLPPELRYTAMAETLAQIGKTGAKLNDDSEADQEVAEALQAAREGLVGPTLVHRNVVASAQCWEDFGPLLASQAWYDGFAATKRKVFISDGSSTIEKLQQTHFSHYTSVLDLLHALSYSLAAARAVNEHEPAARRQYDAWAAMIWEGRVADVIADLAAWSERLGAPPPEARADDPREVVRVSRGYYQNHAPRMDYPSYRRQGFPLTSSLMESTVKQVSRRVKGSEKYWSPAGSEIMLRLRGEYLSDDNPMQAYWQNRSKTATGTRAYRAQQSKVHK